MDKHYRKCLPLLILIGTILGITLSCRLFDDRIELEGEGIWRFYSFNPENILESIAQGNVNPFTLIAETTRAEGRIPALIAATPERAPSNSTMPVQWGQEEYFLIAQTIHEQSWGKPLGSQNLFNMSFELPCSDAELKTFHEAFFQSFEVIQTEEGETRVEHWITIRPRMHSIYTVEVNYQPNVNNKEPLDFSGYHFKAQEVLQIAEESGGDRVRLGVDNACQITLLAPGFDGMGWRILYQDLPSFEVILFNIAIDPLTGESKILIPKP
jgi:hypothetical protein